jgi:hypothetical protein
MPRKDERPIKDMDAYLKEQAKIQQQFIDEYNKKNPPAAEKKTTVDPARVASLNAKFQRAFDKGTKEGKASAKKNAALSPEQRLEFIQKSFHVVPSDRLHAFFQMRGFESYTHLKLEDGFIRGTFDVDYLSPALVSLAALGDELGIDDMMKGGSLSVQWKTEFKGFIPLAILSDEKGEYLHSFLVVDGAHPDAPVFLWDEEGWSLYPLSDSLSGFLLARPPQKKLLSNSHITTPYKKYSWKK